MDNFDLIKVEMNIKKNAEGGIEVNGLDKKKILEQTMNGLTCYEAVCAPREVNNEKNLYISDEKIDRIVKEILRCNICKFY